MKILHWNIHMRTDADGVDNVDRVIELIGDVDPDVISLVEVDEQWGRPAKLLRVAETLGYHWAFVPAFEYRESGGFGNALLSRTPFLSVHQWQLLPPVLYDGTEPTEPRCAILARLLLADGVVTLGATHLPRSCSDLREIASSRLLNLIEYIDGRYVVCGDFNQPPGSWLDRLHAVEPRPPTCTYPAINPSEQIDYCVVFGFRPLGSTVIENTASDHRPITVEVE